MTTLKALRERLRKPKEPPRVYAVENVTITIRDKDGNVTHHSAPGVLSVPERSCGDCGRKTKSAYCPDCLVARSARPFGDEERTCMSCGSLFVGKGRECDHCAG